MSRPRPSHITEARHHIDFDLDRGIRDQVLRKLNKSPKLPLTTEVGPAESGIYALYHKEVFVYIGMVSKTTTKSKRTLRARLGEHLRKIDGAREI